MFKKKPTFLANKAASLKSMTATMLSRGIDDALKGYHSSVVEPLTELLAPTGLNIYTKMRKNDPIIGGMMLLFETAIQRSEYSLKGENASFVMEILDNMRTPFSQILGEIASALTYGFYLGEKIYAIRDGMVVLEDIEPRYQPSIVAIDDSDGLVQQQTTTGIFTMPYSKSLHVVPIQDSRSPFGISLLRTVYKPYYYKLSVEASEALAIDRDLGGLPVMQAPEGFDFLAADPSSPNYDANVAATLDWAVNLVTSVRRDQMMGVVIPAGWTLSIIRGENRATIPTNEIIARYNTEMTAAVLANFLSLGAFASTNNSNVTVHVSNFVNACEAFIKVIAGAIKKQVIDPICTFNRISPSPTIEFTVKGQNNLRDIGTFVANLVDKGVIQPTKFIEDAMLALLNIPRIEETEPEGGQDNAERDTLNDNT